MKIGEFSRRYGVSRDTVRYYVNAGLLIPDDQGAQYQFTERECQDMETILRLKGLCFSLKEIAEYLSVLRVSTMVEPESIRDVVDFMDHKKLELEEQIKSLQEIHEAIDAEIYTFSRLKPRAVKKTGLPLAALHLLACPYCGKGLELKQAPWTATISMTALWSAPAAIRSRLRMESSALEICIQRPMTSRI